MKADRNKIYLAMAKACLTTGELAVKTEMPSSSISNVIAGRSVRPATLGRVAKALGVSVNEILEEPEKL